MIFSVSTMAVAALVERKRQNFVQENTTLDSMSVFWLAPQFLIIGIGDGFVLVGLQEYFYDQVPDSMRSLGIAFYLRVNNAANFLSSLLITVVDRLTEKSGRSWFGKDLNSSRLDYFYWLLGAIIAANFRDGHGDDREYHPDPDSLEDGEPPLVPCRSSQYGYEDSVIDCDGNDHSDGS
nr:protein NRT1/ PTR FAMILY 5.6-like [Ipomoea trifida]